MGFIVFVSLRQDTASQYGEGGNISFSRLRYLANHNTLDSWPIKACLTFKNDELCKKSARFRKTGHRGATTMYSTAEVERVQKYSTQVKVPLHYWNFT